MTTPIDWTRPLQTRDGKPARFLGTRKSTWGTHVVCIDAGESEEVWFANTNGDVPHGGSCSPADIINVPAPKRSGTVWVNVFEDGFAIGHTTRRAANMGTQSNILACVEVPWTEGQGL